MKSIGKPSNIPVRVFHPTTLGRRGGCGSRKYKTSTKHPSASSCMPVIKHTDSMNKRIIESQQKRTKQMLMLDAVKKGQYPSNPLPFGKHLLSQPTVKKYTLSCPFPVSVSKIEISKTNKPIKDVILRRKIKPRTSDSVFHYTKKKSVYKDTWRIISVPNML